MAGSGLVYPRVRAGIVLVVVGALVAAACSTSPSVPDGSGGPRSRAGTDQGTVVASPDGSRSTGADAGFVPTAEWRARQDDYLHWATKDGMEKGSFDSLLANAERAAREPDYKVDLTSAKPADFQAVFDKLHSFADTGDFDVNRMLFVYAGYKDKLDPALAAALEQQFLSFKYWWTEPTPPGITDSQYYWTENHQIIYLANELIAGELFADKVFTNSGMTGKQHVEHAVPLIKRWLDLRARFGWSEWLSNVYYGEDFEGLALIAEHTNDETLGRQASMAIDLLLFDLASHTQNGAFGATHGRSYMKDKMTALDEDTFSLSKLLFDDTTYAYQHVDVAVLAGIAQRYRPPEVLRKVAKSNEVSVDRTHVSLPLDPTAPVTPKPTAPGGFDYQNPDDLMLWWGIGGQFAWQVAPLSVATIQKYNLWPTENFQQAKDLKPIVDASTTEQLQGLAQQLGRQLNPGLLSAVDTYTWRSPEVMLSTAQDWRPGQRGEQDHIWQATIDANAQVFTQHPAKPVPEGDDWYTNSPYWTGDGAMPRSAQTDNVNISLYAPQYTAPDTGPLGSLGYQKFTHAYFPQDAFDEVVQKPASDGGTWTIGRKGDGYIALYSWRPVRWASYDGVTHPTRGMKKPFDLIADGGPDNVWVTEVGQAPGWKTKGPDGFATFTDAITKAPIDVKALASSTPPCPSAPTSPKGASCGHAIGDGFSVAYTSPTKGQLTFSWTDPLKVNGVEVALHADSHYDNPWAHVAAQQKQFAIAAGGSTLTLDFDKSTRTAT